MSPPSLAPRRRRLTQNPGTAPHNDSHWQSLSLSSQSVSSCRHFLPYLEWKQSVCFCTHREEGGGTEEGGREAVSVCVVGAPTALLAAPIKTRPRHLASLYNALSPVPSQCAHFPMIAKCQGRGSRLPGQKNLTHYTLICVPIARGQRDLYTFCSFPFVFTITVRYPLENPNPPRQKGVHDDGGDEWSGEGGRKGERPILDANKHC